MFYYISPFWQSLVILTRLPFVELFQEVMTVIAPEFFDKGSVCLEISAKEIDQWPRPVPGLVLNLPLLGTLFQVSSNLVLFFFASTVSLLCLF